jgi:hypothetical protein
MLLVNNKPMLSLTASASKVQRHLPYYSRPPARAKVIALPLRTRRGKDPNDPNPDPNNHIGSKLGVIYSIANDIFGGSPHFPITTLICAMTYIIMFIISSTWENEDT